MNSVNQIEMALAPARRWFPPGQPATTALLGFFSFSRGPLTPALSSHSLPFVPQPRTLTPDGGDGDGDGDGGGCWCRCGSTAPNIPRAGTRSSRRPAAVEADERLGGGRCGHHRGLVRLQARGLQLPLLSNALLLLVASVFFWAKCASLLNRYGHRS